MWQEETVTSAHPCVHSKKRDSEMCEPVSLLFLGIFVQTTPWLESHTHSLFFQLKITKRQSSGCLQWYLWRDFFPQLWNSFCEVFNKNKNQILRFFSPFGSHRHIHSPFCIFKSALQVVLKPYKYLSPLCSVGHKDGIWTSSSFPPRCAVWAASTYNRLSASISLELTLHCHLPSLGPYFGLTKFHILVTCSTKLATQRAY